MRMFDRLRCPGWRGILVAVGVLAAGLIVLPAAQADIMGFSGGDPNLWTATNFRSGDPPTFDPSTDSVTITTDKGDEHNSVFYSPADLSLPQLRQSVTAFTATFTYQVGGTRGADGATFCWHNDPRGAQAVGDQDGGSALGYQGIQSSAAIAFNVFSGHQGRTDFLFNDVTGNVKNPGGNYLDTSPVEPKLGNPILVTVTYDNTSMNLVETLTDTVTGDTFTQTYPGIDLPGIVGDTTAYVGFTGGTGGATAVQIFSGFTYKEMPEPSTAALAAVGIVGTLVFCWRRRHRARS
jgi:hypothetical protein